MSVLKNAIQQLFSNPLGPIPFYRSLVRTLEDFGEDASPSSVEDFLRALNALDRSQDEFQEIGRGLRKLDSWPNEGNSWTKSTAPYSPERRQLSLAIIGFPADLESRLLSIFPAFGTGDRPIVISRTPTDWYTSAIRNGGYYWPRLRSYLENQWKNEESIALLESSATEIVSRLADPTRLDVYPARGLVIGYVQSGKTANFTSVIAKSVDAGYKLVIVLAGQWNILRQQTQKRLDKELLGKELISASGEENEYLGDKDWTEFVGTESGKPPSAEGEFDIERLTSRDRDYQAAGQHITSLEFHGMQYPSRRINDPANLKTAAAKIVVVKKNPTVLKKLIRDIKRVTTLSREDVPVLVIDDESDQASINTVKPSRNEVKRRSETNKAIVKLLAIFPRAQYLGYTATPAANVFVDPTDENDIFPRDFIVCLRRPLGGYMGVKDFFDFDEDDRPLEGDDRPEGFLSNERAFLRSVGTGEDEDAKLAAAILDYVLAGAIKLYRAEHQGLKFRHHTMLVHRSHKQSEHEMDAERVKEIWNSLALGRQKGWQLLSKHFKEYTQPVSTVRGDTYQVPNSIEGIRNQVEQTVRRIEDSGITRIVNGSKKYFEQAPRFDDEDVWSIIVGGTKLSRGYTVEGLTVSYFLRKSKSADTLMQMGRWFGFRNGFRDLVRVYLQAARDDRRGDFDLKNAFKTLCSDEERLRKKFEIYSKDPAFRPIDVLPVVSSELLLPTSKNKMHNVEMVHDNKGGEWTEKTRTSTKSLDREANFGFLEELISTHERTESTLSFQYPKTASTYSFSALNMRLSTDEIIGWLEKYRWPVDINGFASDITFLKGRENWDPAVDDWCVLLPLNKSGPEIDVHSERIRCVQRSVTSGGRFGAFSDPKHRFAAECITGTVRARKELRVGYDLKLNKQLESLVKPRRGVVLAYLIVERPWTGGVRATPSNVTVGLSLHYPTNNIPTKAEFRVKTSDQNAAWLSK